MSKERYTYIEHPLFELVFAFFVSFILFILMFGQPLKALPYASALTLAYLIFQLGSNYLIRHGKARKR